ncbi:hypothetical protein L9F63_003625 [Diploptera punctata]|uniref:NADH dehydrogenase [ubiquinone] 1 alpha subcomplex assembly factor 2 n=1 Tax=Diploptera punctata TaxID=6984 RepID=A0AAD8E9W5_DIPPU|nr:hypothetical protein L9F63_003625 [Diploptera punctata]
MAKEGRSILAYIFRNFINSLRPRRISGDLVGKDYYGNKYYEIPPNPKIGKRKASRWFVPQTTDKYDFIHEVSPEWEAWLRGRRKDPPTEEELSKNLEIMKQKQLSAKEIDKSLSASKQDVVEKESKGMESFPKYDEYEVMPGKGKGNN